MKNFVTARNTNNVLTRGNTVTTNKLKVLLLVLGSCPNGNDE